MTDCARGCLIHGQHIPGCPHTNECPTDCPNHCEGCAPREAETGNYCWRCTTKLRDALNALPELAVEAHNMPGGRLATTSNHANADRRPTKVDQLSPSPAVDEVDDVCDWAYTVAVDIADHLGHRNGPFTYRQDGTPHKWALTQHVNYLTNNIDAVLSVEWADDIYENAIGYARRLRLRTGTDQLVHRIKDRCPTCNQRTLTREDGADKVICRNINCNRVWTEDEYARLAVVAAS